MGKQLTQCTRRSSTPWGHTGCSVCVRCEYTCSLVIPMHTDSVVAFDIAHISPKCCLLPRYYFLNPLAYTIWGLIGSQLSDVSDVTLTSQTGMQMALNEYMTTTYKFWHAFIGVAAAVLIAFIVFFHLLTVFALQRLNYLKR